jgi:hypothetical protein
MVHGLTLKAGSVTWRGLKGNYVQSIIGATEKRRESGAGAAVVTDMGDLESVRLGGGEFIRIARVGLACPDMVNPQAHGRSCHLHPMELRVQENKFVILFPCIQRRSPAKGLAYRQPLWMKGPGLLKTDYGCK